MNVKEALEYLHSLSDDEDATHKDTALDDGAESDVDDPGEDVVEVDENENLFGPELVAKPPHIELSNKNSCLESSLSRSTPVKFQKDSVEKFSINHK